MSIQVLHAETPTARKRHRCDNCSRVIEPNETYHRTDCVGDSGRYAWKSCAHCQALWEHMWLTDPELRYYDDGVDMLEYLRDTSHPKLALFEALWSNGTALVPMADATSGLPVAGQ